MKRTELAKLASVAILLIFTGAAQAQSPLGIGAAEPSIMPGGPGWQVLAWINQEQQAFYRALTGALGAMRADPWKLWTLLGLSFAYGVFHAAGPGHGKAIISSYMIANEVALRRGVLLSFLSSMLQGVMAILVVGAAYLVLRGTTISLSDATLYLEQASYLLIALFGAWLLWRKLGGTRAGRNGHDHAAHHHTHAGEGHAHPVEQAARHAHDHQHAHLHDHGYGEMALAAVPGMAMAGAAGAAAVHVHHHDGHHHAEGEVCAACGHLHAPDPALISGEDFKLREAWSAVVAVGLRPCSGALLVLTFSLLNGLYLGGILSVFAMALGTAITVSVLATLAVTAKGLAVRLSGASRAGQVGLAIEVLGAVLVLALGVLLFAATLTPQT